MMATAGERGGGPISQRENKYFTTCKPVSDM